MLAAKKNRKFTGLKVRLDRLVNPIVHFFRRVCGENRRKGRNAMPSKVAEQFFVEMFHLVGNVQNGFGTFGGAAEEADRPLVGDRNDPIPCRQGIASVAGKGKKRWCHSTMTKSHFEVGAEVGAFA